MVDADPESKEKLLTKIILALLIVIIVIGSIYLFYSMNNNSEDGFTLATDYQSISSSNGYEIYNSYNTSYSEENNNVNNLTIIDARKFDYSCNCQLNPTYEEGHLPGAILDYSPQAETYYNMTTDILVYTQYGESEKANEFCENLIGHIYGNIYLLEGGYEAWEEAGNPIEKGFS